MTTSAQTSDFERDRLANVLGAFALALSDRINAALRAANDRSPTAIAALIQIGFDPQGLSVERLRLMIGLTHSATVRVIDQLEGDGLVTRRRNVGRDSRMSVLGLTPAGQAAMREALSARNRVCAALLADFTPQQLQAFSSVLDRMIPGVVDFGNEQDVVCRLCDMDVCPQDRCPVNTCVFDSADG